MFDTAFGLPLHVLVLHLAVVGVPVAALASIAVTVRLGRLNAKLGPLTVVWWVALLDALGFLTVWVTKLSGEEFAERQFPDGQRPPAVQKHIDLGNDLFWYALALLVVALLLAFAVQRALPQIGITVLAVMVVAMAVLTTVQTIRTGHQGSKAVWSTN
jgi:hypothetical protein